MFNFIKKLFKTYTHLEHKPITTKFASHKEFFFNASPEIMSEFLKHQKIKLKELESGSMSSADYILWKNNYYKTINES